ncbi:hypothetical protein C7293_09380 [filamentous cyanobacterium CCT1]|nr:hypothetical protein C7293_09380 [filamentous cyanobacterium CCT1]PSN81495.1 hypothetical protein C8B47_00980 [filamentous cyanobacterium CCP4]
MRYSIMLQLVTTISVIFISGAALFAWIQNRQIEPIEPTGENRRFNHKLLLVDKNLFLQVNSQINS